MASPPTVIVGQTVVVGTTPPGFVDRDGVPVDPSTVTLTVVDPTGAPTVLTKLELDNPAVGVYEAEVTLHLAGNWRVRLEGSVAGEGSAVAETIICVTPSLIGATS